MKVALSESQDSLELEKNGVGILWSAYLWVACDSGGCRLHVLEKPEGYGAGGEKVRDLVTEWLRSGRCMLVWIWRRTEFRAYIGAACCSWDSRLKKRGFVRDQSRVRVASRLELGKSS